MIFSELSAHKLAIGSETKIIGVKFVYVKLSTTFRWMFAGVRVTKTR